MAGEGHAASEQITATAHRFIHCLRPQNAGSNDVDKAGILANVTPAAAFDFGHSFFVSTAPPIQGTHSGDEFVSRMSSMAASFRTWDIEIRETCADTNSRTVVVRADFLMTPQLGEPVLNDIVFWVGLDDLSEKVIRCTEFIDPVANAELRRRMESVEH